MTKPPQRTLASAYEDALTATQLAHIFFTDERYAAWFEENKGDFDGMADIYSYVAETAQAMERAVELNGGYEELDWYVTCGRVVEALFAERIPRSRDEWARLIADELEDKSCSLSKR